MKGIYFNSRTNEIMNVAERGSHPSDEWVKISDEPATGLLDARRRLEELSLVRDARAVHWYGLRGGVADHDGALSELICRLKQEAEQAERRRDGRDGWLQRLARRLQTLFGGTGGDGGHPSSLVPVPVKSRHPGRRARPR